MTNCSWMNTMAVMMMLAFLPACGGDGNGDTDTDSDSDSDVDTDTDSKVDPVSRTTWTVV